MWSRKQSCENFEKVCKQFFLREEKYPMCRISHVKKEWRVVNVGLFEGQI